MSTSGPHLSVLIVDPDMDKNSALKKVLKGVGVQNIYEATQGGKVIETANEYRPALIVLGDNFPGTSTVELLRELGQYPGLEKTPCVVHSKRLDPSKIRELITQGAVGIIDFPADASSVKRALRNCFRKDNSKKVVKFLKQAKFFHEFSNEDLETLVKVAIPRKYSKGETIIGKGEPSDTFYCLLKGEVEVIINKEDGENITVPIKAGNPFGEMGILDKQPRSADCIAASEALVLEVGSYILADPDYVLRLRIFSALTFVLAARLRQMNDFVQHSIEEKKPAPEKENPRLLKAQDRVPPPKPEEEPNKETPEEGDKEELAAENPFTAPTAFSEEVQEMGQDEFDVMSRKIRLRTDFILEKIPQGMREMIQNKLFSYWTGSKLSKANLHNLWNPKWFNPGSTRLKRAMHLVVCSPYGQQAYKEAYMEMPLSHVVAGASQVGCVGTFLDTKDAIERYCIGRSLKWAIKQDLEMAIDRLWKGKDVIEFLTHTMEDARRETLFLVFDRKNGETTRLIREAFPNHQIVTVVKGFGFDPEEPTKFFTSMEEQMLAEGVLMGKREYKGEGFFAGQTFFLPDLSVLYKGIDRLHRAGHLFGLVGTIAHMGPDYSGISWGSKGGAEGAVKAARAMFGIKGAQSAQDIASAINWADG